MIRLSKPDNGWIEICICNSDKYEFSDVGPDTIGQLEEAVDKLNNLETNFFVECNLEPALLKLKFSQADDQTRLDLYLEKEKCNSFTLPTDELASTIKKEISKIKPLCNGVNWTR